MKHFQELHVIKQAYSWRKSFCNLFFVVVVVPLDGNKQSFQLTLTVVHVLINVSSYKRINICCSPMKALQ